MIVLGGLDDQTILLVWAGISEGLFSLPKHLAVFPQYAYLFNGLIHPNLANEPLSAALISALLSLFGPNGYFLLLIMTCLLNVAGSYTYFKKFKYGIIYSLIFSFSAYFWSHFSIHILLMQIWIFPIFLWLLEKYYISLKPKNGIILGAYFTLALAITNYYAYFLLLLFALFTFFAVVINLVSHWQEKDKTNKLLQLVTFSFVTYATFCMFAIPLVYTYIRANYGQSEQSKPNTNVRVQRPYEDFFTFSSRPWYYIIPPVDNVLVGNYSKTALELIRKTDYFLADDYFKTEHAGSYFGVQLLITAAVTSIIRARKEKTKITEHTLIYVLVLAALFLIAMPPFVTISGLKIYMPSELLYKLFPMFRVLARLNIVILLMFLAILASNIEYLVNRPSQQARKIYPRYLALLLIITLLETFIPPKIVSFDTAPEAYSYLNNNVPTQSVFAVYPFSKAQEAFFWLPIHNKYIYNLRYYDENGFSTSEFTNKLTTPQGLANAKNKEIDYLLVNKKIPSDKLNFFVTQLKVKKEFSDSILFTWQ